MFTRSPSLCSQSPTQADARTSFWHLELCGKSLSSSRFDQRIQRPEKKTTPQVHHAANNYQRKVDRSEELGVNGNFNG